MGEPIIPRRSPKQPTYSAELFTAWGGVHRADLPGNLPGQSVKGLRNGPFAGVHEVTVTFVSSQSAIRLREAVLNSHLWRSGAVCSNYFFGKFSIV